MSELLELIKNAKDTIGLSLVCVISLIMFYLVVKAEMNIYIRVIFLFILLFFILVNFFNIIKGVI